MVDHPSHLRRESEKIASYVNGIEVFSEKRLSGTSKRDGECLACDNQFTTITTTRCTNCDDISEFIVEGPPLCFEGKHTREPLPESDKRRVWKDVVTILPWDHLQVMIRSASPPICRYDYFFLLRGRSIHCFLLKMRPRSRFSTSLMDVAILSSQCLSTTA